MIEQCEQDDGDFIEVDDLLREIRNGIEPNQYPPGDKAIGELTYFHRHSSNVQGFSERMTELLDGLLSKASPTDELKATNQYQQDAKS